MGAEALLANAHVAAAATWAAVPSPMTSPLAAAVAASGATVLAMMAMLAAAAVFTVLAAAFIVYKRRGAVHSHPARGSHALELAAIGSASDRESDQEAIAELH